jgi:TRAP-type mannitol/chloroaromatic compound transport system permease small subunit
MIDILTRLLFVAPFWLAALAFLAMRRRYATANLASVAAGSALFLIALASDPSAGAYLALAGLGVLLWLRGTEAEQRRTGRLSGETTTS